MFRPLARFALAVVFVALPAWAATLPITDDTYVDSFAAIPGNPLADNTRMNYGTQGAVKAVTSPGSTSFPDAKSLTHTLLTLPGGFWADIGTADVASAVVTYGVRNNSLAGRQLELHPLTRPFVAGTGGSPASTMGGAPNTDAAPLGADWFTADGRTASAWATPGGDFDARFVLADTVATGNATFRWDITTLVNDPATRALIRANGLLLKPINETDYPSPQQFVSLHSSDSTNVALRPSVTYTAVPEPAVLGFTVAAGVLLVRRRRIA